MAAPISQSEELLLAALELRLIPSVKMMFETAGHFARPEVFALTLNRIPTG